MAQQVKVHLALNVGGLEESVKFYRTMFGVAPVKWKPGYAKFDIADPPLNLTLNYSGNRWEIFTVKIGDTKPEQNVTDNKSNSAQPQGCCLVSPS